MPSELGASYFMQTQHGKKEGSVPAVDLESEKKLQEFLISEIEAGKIKAADLSEVVYWFAFQNALVKKISVLKFQLHPKFIRV